jgi:hypothetical protein
VIKELNMKEKLIISILLILGCKDVSDVREICREIERARCEKKALCKEDIEKQRCIVLSYEECRRRYKKGTRRPSSIEVKKCIESIFDSSCSEFLSQKLSPECNFFKDGGTID